MVAVVAPAGLGLRVPLFFLRLRTQPEQLNDKTVHAPRGVFSHHSPPLWCRRSSPVQTVKRPAQPPCYERSCTRYLHFNGHHRRTCALDPCDVWHFFFCFRTRRVFVKTFWSLALSLFKMQKKELKAEMRTKRLADVGQGANGP